MAQRFLAIVSTDKYKPVELFRSCDLLN